MLVENDSRFGFLVSEDVKDKWHRARHGKFTASKLSCLLSPGKNTMFGTGAKTYIKQKAKEKMTILWERPDMELVKSIRHGKLYESIAVPAYHEHTRNYSMRYFGSEDPVFLDYNDDSGGSPDGLMGEDETIYCGLEIKAPFDSNVHMDYLEMTNQYDLEAYNFEYYSQIQFLLMITGAPVWHFCSFDERFLNKKLWTKVIEVFPDKKLHEKISIYLKQAVIERNLIIERFEKIAHAT